MTRALDLTHGVLPVIRRTILEFTRFDNESSNFTHSSDALESCSCPTSCYPRQWYFYRHYFRFCLSVLGNPVRAASVSHKQPFLVDLICYCQVLATCVTAFPKHFQRTRETTKRHNMVLPAHSSHQMSQSSHWLQVPFFSARF